MLKTIKINTTIYLRLLLVLSFVFSFKISFSKKDYYIIVDSIIINGNKLTKAYVIQNEILLKHKEIYKKSELNDLILQSKNLLINTNLFIFCDISFIEYKYQHIFLNINVTENWYLWPIPSFELSDRNFKQWQLMDYKLNRTNYGMYLFKYNLKGRNETLKLAFINGYTRKYALYFLKPYFFKNLKLGAEFSSSFKQNKEIWYITKNNKIQFYKNYEKPIIQRWENNVSLIVRRNNFMTEKWEIEYNNIKIDKKIIYDSLNKNFLLGGNKQNEIYIKQTMNYEKRNNKYYPLTGFYLKNELKLGSISSENSAEIISETFEAAYYSQIAKRLYLSGFFKGKLTNQLMSYIPYYNFKALGYTDYVRGYEQYVIDGHAFLLAKANIKFALINQYKLKIPFKLNKKYISLPIGTYLNLFTDWGKTYNNQWQEKFYGFNNTLANKNLLGYGCGIDFLALNDKILRVEYSQNILEEKNINLHFKKAF
ncbi:MAG: BamA/TamA family outer membrane protein [Bacteroidetes bacterium]|nr:BamA/TamA family outer membrane protein [Bacteroidota bacterium]